MTDPDSRRAARIATLVAVPAALITGALILWLVGSPLPEKSGKPDSSASNGPTAPVSMPARDLPPTPAEECRELLSELPDTLRDKHRRPVAAGPEQNAAYGEPPVRLRCGVDPVKVPATATVYPLSGVCWLPRKGDGETVWTTVDRAVPVSVTVPGKRAGSGQWATAFSKYVGQTLPRSDAPSGCRE